MSAGPVLLQLGDPPSWIDWRTRSAGKKSSLCSFYGRLHQAPNTALVIALAGGLQVRLFCEYDGVLMAGRAVPLRRWPSRSGGEMWEFLSDEPLLGMEALMLEVNW